MTEDPVKKAGHPKSKIGRLMAPQKIRLKITHIVSVPIKIYTEGRGRRDRLQIENQLQFYIHCAYFLQEKVCLIHG